MEPILKPRRNNRVAGHTFERFCRTWFRTLGWKECETSRYASRKTDDLKIDLVDTFPFQVQCKYTQAMNYAAELGKMPVTKPGVYNVIFHKKKIPGKAASEGTYVIMRLEDFGDLMQKTIKEGVIIPMPLKDNELVLPN